MRRPSIARLLGSAAVMALLATALGGCKTMGDIAGPLTSSSDTAAETDPRRAAEVYGERYRANPKDADAALGYGTALRATGQRAQAAAVLEQASLAHPGNRPLLAAYGRALADNGNFQQAFDVLNRAHKPEDPDWTILSAQGATLDQLGRFDEARQYYASALKIVPDEPSVLCNLGLSYVLSKDLPKADEALRRAYSLAGSDPRIRANRAMVLGLQGRMNEAEIIAKADLPPDEAAANVTALRQVLARKKQAGGEKLPVASAKNSD